MYLAASLILFFRVNQQAPGKDIFLALNGGDLRYELMPSRAESRPRDPMAVSHDGGDNSFIDSVAECCVYCGYYRDG